MVSGALAPGRDAVTDPDDIDTSFVAHLMPAQVLLGLGLGFTFVPLSSSGLVGVPEHDAGAASATLTPPSNRRFAGHRTAHPLFTSGVTAYWPLRSGPVRPGQAQIEGYRVAFAWGAG